MSDIPEHRLTPEVATALRSGPFHVALRAAIQARGLGLDRVRHHLSERGLDVSTTSLSYWQHGKTRPEQPKSLRAVSALEQILNLPDRSLRLLLGPKRARGPRNLRTGNPRPELAIGGGAAMRELCDQMPYAREHMLDILTAQVTVRLNADRREVWQEVTLLMRARREDVDRHIAIYSGDPGCRIDDVAIDPGRDCDLGAIVRHQEEPVLLAEILFGENLGKDDTHLFSYTVADGTTESTGYGQGFRYPTGHFMLQIRFDPATPPSRIYRFAQSRLDTERRETGDVALSSRYTAQLTAANVQPGTLGIGWEW